MFDRNTKAEGLGVGSEGAAGEKNMHDAVRNLSNSLITRQNY